MKFPLVSVVIPTASRPHFLHKAIESALAGMGADIEVVVIPNGSDESWKTLLHRYLNDSRVSFFPIEVGHGNVARNAGLHRASGKYVRFLDDDDEIYPDTAVRQYEAMESHDFDLCSAAVELVTADGRSQEIWAVPDSDDPVSATLDSKRLTLPTAHVYRRSFIERSRWSPAVDIGQDIHWAYQLCRREISWAKVPGVAGMWRQHDGPRTSRSDSIEKIHRLTAELSFQLIHELKANSSLTNERASAAANGLWFCAHNSFYLNPRYWTEVIVRIMNQFPGTYPDVGWYRTKIGGMIHPLFFERTMLPKRRLNRALESLREKYRN
ncbi:glycosyltransferase family 2 protein [Variovorax sp. J31P207]|uniref:glycosyltransferase family 2 protein n=1 Tax=Variovorax sp. J31P207 TaxID=3053510 RepID=UPI00257647C7|nr:glycosyltransferase family 2 protein [Variovorax sp. J31P207]MDM0065648.1 glycosyltransferase family 2 protein [Variovorax sp. J31P207]